MLAAFKKGGGTPPAPPPQTSSGGGNEQNASSSSDPSATPAAPKAEEPKQGLILRAIEWLGPSDASAVPLPLLILAGVAFLLLAAAGGSLVNRRLQERRAAAARRSANPRSTGVVHPAPAVASRTRNDPE